MILDVLVAALLIIPGVLWCVNHVLFRCYREWLANFVIAAASSFIIYVLLLGAVTYEEQKLDAELAAFDRDGNGVFSGEEITPAQQRAMHRVVDDTGRTFAPFTGAVFGFIYFLGLWLVFSMVTWARLILVKWFI